MSMVKRIETVESGVFIDDIKLQDVGIEALLDSDEPLFPDVRENSIVIPGRHGAYNFGSYLQPLEFSLRCAFDRSDSYTDLAHRIREFKRLFTDAYGRPKRVKLRFESEPDKFYYVEYSGRVPIERVAKYGFFSLPLKAYDPHAYATFNAYDPQNQNYNTGLQYDTGIMYPNTTGFDWKYSMHYSGVHNHSYYETTLKIVIKGDCKNPKITNLATGKWIRINETFASADELIIDAKSWTVVKNRTVNLLNNYEGDFIQLTEGDNGFLFESETEPSATVTFEWNHLFI